MSLGEISATGRKTNYIGSSTFMNIVSIPVTSSWDVPTKLVFLSNINVNNFSDLMQVVSYYNTYGQNLYLVAGELISNTTNNPRYPVCYLFLYGNGDLYLAYKYTNDSLTYIRLVASGETPSNWTYTNIPL